MASNNLSYNTPYQIGQPGSVVSGGGGGQLLVGARSILDARRMMQGARTPAAQYPDGYLGETSSRRGERLLPPLASRGALRPYDRGVHKGVRIDPGDYYWPPEFNPNTGLEYEARGRKWAPPDREAPRLVHDGRYPLDAHHDSQLQRLRPAWR